MLKDSRDKASRPIKGLSKINTLGSSIKLLIINSLRSSPLDKETILLDKESDKNPETQDPNAMTPAQQAELEKYIADLKHQQALDNMVQPDLSRPTNLINMATNGHPYVQQPTPQAKPDLSRPTNLLNMAANGKMYENKLTQKPSEPTAAVQQENKPKDGEELEPVRTYIPSSAPVNLAGVQQDTTAVDEALKKSDKVEKQAMETLAMKW